MTEQFDWNQRLGQLLPQLPKDLNREKITLMATSPRVDLRPVSAAGLRLRVREHPPLN